jgi:hypothetical protein
MVSQWRHNGVTMVLQWCYNGVTTVLQGYHNIPQQQTQHVWQQTCLHYMQNTFNNKKLKFCEK